MTRNIKAIVAIMMGSSLVQTTIYPAGDIGSKKGAVIMEQVQENDISPVEDLMREHGILARLLLIYDEITNRFEHNENPLIFLKQATAIVQEFIENYHEKLEENYIFPLFEKQKKEVDLIQALLRQHERGRAITAQLKTISQSTKLLDTKTRKRAVTLIKKFIRMYRPHKAREDTVLFPQIRSLISNKEFEDLGEKFENKEHELFGEQGFFSTVNKVEEIEKELGIYNLNRFTP